MNTTGRLGPKGPVTIGRLARAILLFLLGGSSGFVLPLIATDPQDNLTVVETAFRYEPSGGRVATGTVRNNTGRPYSRLRVEIDLLSEYGSVVGQTSASTDSLGAATTWHFKAPVTREEAVGFRVAALLAPGGMRGR